MKTLICFTLLALCACDNDRAERERAKAAADDIEDRARESRRAAAAEETRHQQMANREKMDRPEIERYQKKIAEIKARLPDMRPGGALEAALLEIKDCEKKIEEREAWIRGDK